MEQTPPSEANKEYHYFLKKPPHFMNPKVHYHTHNSRQDHILSQINQMYTPNPIFLGNILILSPILANILQASPG
jgi:hypothetical protein